MFDRSTIRPALGFVVAVAVVSVGARMADVDADDAALDRLWTSFFDAASPGEAAPYADEIVEAGDTFDAARERLRTGRSYSAAVTTGRQALSQANQDGVDHPYLLFVPASYDPTRRYPVRVYLHGGVARPQLPRDGRWWRNTDAQIKEDALSIFPASWQESLWWNYSQVENLAGILDSVKREYNVDENRVHAIGVSDGASGLYYHASLAPTPWAGFLPFIRHPAVIMNPRTGSDGRLRIPNLRNKPFYIVNVDDDRLYPVAAMRSWITRFRAAGTDLTFREIDGTGHNTRWWPEETEAIDRFIAESARDPLPHRLIWETGRTDRSSRIQWLIVSELARDRDAENPGPIELERDGNTVRVTTDGVRRFQRLLSLDRFDFSRPVTIVTNEVVSLDRLIVPSVETLLRWAARDNDRTLLVGAEVSVDEPRVTR